MRFSSYIGSHGNSDAARPRGVASCFSPLVHAALSCDGRHRLWTGAALVWIGCSAMRRHRTKTCSGHDSMVI